MLNYYCHRNLYDNVTLLEYWFLKLNVNKGHCKVSLKSMASLLEDTEFCTFLPVKLDALFAYLINLTCSLKSTRCLQNCFKWSALF